MINLLKNEINFQPFFYTMAGSNLLLARNYLNSAFTGVFTHSETTRSSQLGLKTLLTQPANPISIQLSLKNRCFNLIKAPLLLVRTLFLYTPLLNRVTQLALRCLSPRNPVDFINSCSSPPEKAEVRIRYNPLTYVENLIKSKTQDHIKTGQKITQQTLKLSDREEVGIISLGLTTHDYYSACMDALENNPSALYQMSLSN